MEQEFPLGVAILVKAMCQDIATGPVQVRDKGGHVGLVGLEEDLMQVPGDLGNQREALRYSLLAGCRDSSWWATAGMGGRRGAPNRAAPLKCMCCTCS